MLRFGSFDLWLDLNYSGAQDISNMIDFDYDHSFQDYINGGVVVLATHIVIRAGQRLKF